MPIQFDIIKFGDVDKDRDVEVEIESISNGNFVSVYLTQDQIKKVIEHLQAQILDNTEK